MVADGAALSIWPDRRGSRLRTGIRDMAGGGMKRPKISRGAGSETGVVCMLHPHCHAMTRLFANHGEDHLNGFLPNDGKSLMQTNFKHGLAAVAANIESLLLQQASALRETVARIVGEIVRCRQRLRPGRSYERRSRKPFGKWHRERGAPATTAR